MDHSQQQQPLWSSLKVDASSSLVNSINTPPRRGSLPPTLESPFSTPSSSTTSTNNNNATRRNSNNSTKMTAKKKASAATSSRRRASLTTNYHYGRRGHSDMALVSSSSSSSGISTSSSSSGLFRPSSKKRLRRSISWDVRPPKVHELKRAVKTSSLKEEAAATASGTEDNRDAVGGGKNNESWYSKQEYSAIIQEQMKSIMIMRYLRENGSDDSEIDPEIYCERGLESYQSKERRHEIDMKRKLHRCLVIQEQTRQAMMGTKDPELLGQLASTQSEGSQMKAQLRAALDQHEAISNSQKPLSEQEKLQVALAQHNRMIMEKQRNGMQQNSTMESGETDDSTGGIIPLSSLWAQEGASFPSHNLASKGAGGVDNGLTSNSSPRPSTASYFQANALFKDSPNDHGMKTDRQKPFAYHSSNNINGTNQHSGMPIVGFHGMYQSSAFGNKPSAPVMSPQALHNAFCSSFAHASGPQQEQQEQQQQRFHRAVFPSKVNHHNTGGSYPLDSVASIMPTSAFAAMHLQRSQVQQDPTKSKPTITQSSYSKQQYGTPSFSDGTASS